MVLRELCGYRLSDGVEPGQERLTQRSAVRAGGATSFHAIADALNARGVRMGHGSRGTWHASPVRNVVLRGAAAAGTSTPLPWNNLYRPPGQG